MTDSKRKHNTKEILQKWRDANLECHRLRSISIRPRQRVNIHRKIVDLCKFYLSNVNLVQDPTTRNLMGKDGSILLSALLFKPKMCRVASGDSHLIAEALREHERDERGIFQGLLRLLLHSLTRSYILSRLNSGTFECLIGIADQDPSNTHKKKIATDW